MGGAVGGLFEDCWRGVVLGEGGPLTPDPSPPFHGGEGRIWGGAGLTRSREAAKEDAKSSCEWAVFEYEYEGCREVGF